MTGIHLRPPLSTIIVAMTALLATPYVLSTTETISQDRPYAEHVRCETDANGAQQCKIDLYLTRGFRAFSQCQVCHGLDGNGSSFAPSLNEKLKEIDRGRFIQVVAEGYKGQIGVMPGWKENPNVMKYLDQLYLYLLARSDGAIPAGKIQRYDRKPR